MAVENAVTETKVIETKPTESRKDAIAAAVASVEEPAVETKVEGEVEDKKPATEVKKPTPQEVAEEEQLKEQGKQLLLALKDPTKAGVVIQYLAEQAGYTKNMDKVKTEKEADKIVKSVEDYFKEELGAEFDFLAPKIAKGVERALAAKLDESQKDIREQFEQQQMEKTQGQSIDAIEKLTVGFFGEGEDLPPALVAEMSKYMDRVPAGENVTVKEYVEDAFNASVGKLGLVKVDKSKQQRTNKNRTDASSRLASERTPSPDSLVEDRSKPIDRRTAIRLAVEQLEKE